MINPVPLHEFCPGPALAAVLHALLPEQSFPPMHLTFAGSELELDGLLAFRAEGHMRVRNYDAF
jgi:hypothetical protein